jgi:signal transduction histidine kinase
MKRIFSWSAWSITTKILFLFLGLSVISMSITGYITLTNIQGMGDYALKTSTSLGERAIQDSTAHLNKLGEDSINQIAKSVAKHLELFFASHAPMNLQEMRNDEGLREIAVQPVGATGYTTLLDSNDFIIIIHKYPEQEKYLSSLKDTLPSFWAVLMSSAGGKAISGYYDWLEVDGSIRQKYASIVPINNPNGDALTLWATTYIDEFSRPAEETKKEINAAITDSGIHINQNVSEMQDAFVIIFTVLVNLVIGIGLLLSRVITRPIFALKMGAEEIGKGKLDYKLEVKNKDELGDLAASFNNMAAALKNNMEELKRTAVINISKERKIQENLHLYVQKVSEAQEAERKRIARELHDETAQALVIVARHLEDLAAGKSRLSAEDIRGEVRKILEGVRHFSQELRPSILDDLGLVPAIKWLASDLTKNYGITVITEFKGDQHPLSNETELNLFRIIQEAFTNVRKHSEAKEASITLSFTEDKVIIVIRDNGKGFNMPGRMGDFARTGKLGLNGMQERAQLLGGNINIESQPGKGATIKIVIPVQRKFDK